MRESTRLKDSKGVEIHEGDIVIRHRNAPSIVETVHYENSAWTLVGNDGKRLLESVNHYCEVYGNIYDNEESD